MRAYRLLIPLAALLAVLPMALSGPSCGHDFDFHLLSWLEASTQIVHGGYPQWAFTPAWNAGEPRFIFYPPLSWLLGAALGLVLPWIAVPAAFTWVALTLSGFAAHRLARAYAGPGASLLAAIAYLANPYILFTAYERTAYGELLAAAWMPLLFTAALAPKLRLQALAIPVALLWLTNAPAGVMGCYALALLLAVRLLFSARRSGFRAMREIALPAIGGVTLGLALAAFYLLPAAFERRFIQADMAVIAGMRIADNTLFHHMLPATEDTLYHDQVLHTASLIACILIACILLSALVMLTRRHKPVASGTSVRHPLAALVLVIGFLLTPLSLGVWAHTPQLGYLQFSWRLCALLAPVFALALALALESFKPVPRPALQTASTALLACILILPGWRLFHQTCAMEDAVPTRVALFHSNQGTESTDEYTPHEADPDTLHPHDPPYWLSDPTTRNAPAPADAEPGPAPGQLNLTLPNPELLILNRRQYPFWRITVNGQIAEPFEPARDDGLLAVPLPAGNSAVTLTALTTLDRRAGEGISLLALLLMAFTTIRRRRRIQFAHPHPQAPVRQ